MRAEWWRWLSADTGRLVAGAVATMIVVVAAMIGFLEPVSLAITVGGTFGVAWATYSSEGLKAAWEQVRRVVEELAEGDRAETLIRDFKDMARIQRTAGLRTLDEVGQRAEDPFVRAAIARVVEASDVPELRDALRADAMTELGRLRAAGGVLDTLGKLFPAFGLIGTLIGLVLLLDRIGDASLGEMGPILAITVLTTLYGAICANVVVLPLSARLDAFVLRRRRDLEMIALGAEMVFRSDYPSRVERVLRAQAGQAMTGDLEAGILLTENAA